MIRIFYCNSTDTDVPNGISEYRLNKINSATKDRQAMINTARALKVGFASFGINENGVIYEFSENGKPFAINFPKTHFSISHSGNFSIIAFSENIIGIDCENNTHSISKEILNRYFSKEESRAFATAPLRLWIAKEAFVKYTGKGFALGRSEIQIPYFNDEITVNDIWFKHLVIDDLDIVVCTDKSDEIQITHI